MDIFFLFICYAEDDYEAFRALSQITPSLQVLIRVGDDANRKRRDETIPTNAQACRSLTVCDLVLMFYRKAPVSIDAPRIVLLLNPPLAHRQ